jgi:hypothetical protein
MALVPAVIKASLAMLPPLFGDVVKDLLPSGKPTGRDLDIWASMKMLAARPLARNSGGKGARHARPPPPVSANNAL